MGNSFKYLKHLERNTLSNFSTVVTFMCLFISYLPLDCRAMGKRAPASYIPDDDVIVNPVDNELSFYHRYISTDNSSDVVLSRNQIKVWNDNQLYAEQYGMDTSLAGSPFYVPTQQEKLEYFKNRYLRYLRGKGEQPIKNLPKDIYNNYRASNQVDSIDEMESRFKATHSKTSSGTELPAGFRQTEVNLWKKHRFIFQPRVDQGLAIVGIKGPYVYARAWVGVNGRTEINVQHSTDSIGLRIMWNYNANTGEYFSSVDQQLMTNLYFRFTSQKNPRLPAGTVGREDNSGMLLYAKQF